MTENNIIDPEKCKFFDAKGCPLDASECSCDCKHFVAKEEQNVQVKVAETVALNKKSNVKNFLMRKLETFGKFKQSQALRIVRYDEPVRCPICDAIVFYAVFVSFNDKERMFNIRNVCAKCCFNAGVVALSDENFNELSKTGVIDPKLVMPFELIKKMHCSCNSCFASISKGVKAWTYFRGMPVKLTLCDKCYEARAKVVVKEESECPGNCDNCGSEPCELDAYKKDDDDDFGTCGSI